jgi:two-component system, NtrC family, nitrogen regulation sensor histidine kinase GlnL
MSVAHDYSYASPLSQFEPTELLDSLSTGIVVLDAHLCPIYANVAAQDFMAVSLQQARGRPFAELFFDSRQLLDVLQRSLRNLETCTQHELALKALGSAIHREASVIDLIVTPLEGQVTGTYLLLEMTDATQRQRISRDNDILSDMDASRLMVRQLAHEVKNPLGGLRGAAQLLEKELTDPGLREYTAVIISEADRLVALVDSMASSSGPPRKNLLNIHEICEHVWRLLRAEAPADVQVERDYDPSLPDGLFDRHQVIQALLNVARNAMQAVGEHGQVLIRTRVRSGLSIGQKRYRLAAVIEVEDDGPGVPTNLIKTLFLPLVTGRNNGTGLGLAVAQDLVTRHGGIIEFTSQPGHTIFSMLLPLEDAPE